MREEFLGWKVMSTRKKVFYLAFFAILFFLFGLVSVSNTENFREKAVEISGTVIHSEKYKWRPSDLARYKTTIEYIKNGKKTHYTYIALQQYPIGSEIQLLVDLREHGAPATHESRSGVWGAAIFLFVFSAGLLILAIRAWFVG